MDLYINKKPITQFMCEYVIPNVIHSQHALARMKFIVLRNALKYRALCTNTMQLLIELRSA